MSQERTLDVSWGAIFKIALVGLLAYVAYLVKDILILTLFAVIISVLLEPIIEFLQRRKIPRGPATIIVYLAIFGLIILLIYSFAAIFVTEIQKFIQIFPEYFEKLSPFLRGIGLKAFENVETSIEFLNKSLERILSGFLGTVSAIFGGLFATVYVITIALFLSLEEGVVERALVLLFPKKYENFVLNLWHRCQKKISGWFLSRIIASIFVGGAAYFSFLIIGTKYPFILGFLAGILDFVPIVGPIITGIIVAVLVSLDSVSKAIIAIIAITVIHQLEGNLLTPILTKKLVNVSPVVVLLALVIGGELLGILGAILAIPLAGIITEFLKEFLEKRRNEGIAAG